MNTVILIASSLAGALFLAGCTEGESLDEDVARALVDVVYSQKNPMQTGVDFSEIESLCDYSEYIAGLGGQPTGYDINVSLAWKFYEWGFVDEAFALIENSKQDATRIERDFHIILLSLVGQESRLMDVLNESDPVPVGKRALQLVARGEYGRAFLSAIEVLRTNVDESDRRRFFLYAEFVSRVVADLDHSESLVAKNNFFESLLVVFLNGLEFEAFVERLGNKTQDYFQTVLLNSMILISSNAFTYFDSVMAFDEAEKWRERLSSIKNALEESEDNRVQWVAYLLRSEERGQAL